MRSEFAKNKHHTSHGCGANSLVVEVHVFDFVWVNVECKGILVYILLHPAMHTLLLLLLFIFFGL